MTEQSRKQITLGSRIEKPEVINKYAAGEETGFWNDKAS